MDLIVCEDENKHSKIFKQLSELIKNLICLCKSLEMQFFYHSILPLKQCKKLIILISIKNNL